MWVEQHGPAWRIRDRVGGKKVIVADGYKTKTAAKRAMTLLAGDQARGDLVMPRAGSITLGEWIEKWWSARVNQLAPNTQRTEWSRIKTHIVPALGGEALSDLSPLTVQRWVSELGKRKAAKTVANAHGALHTILAGAVDERLIRVNPCANTRLPRRVPREMRFLTEPEAARLVAAMPEYHRALVVTALGTGLRWGELAGLRVGRVDVLGGTLRVEETLSELQGGAELVFGPPKTAWSRRTVSLSDETRQALAGLVMARDVDDLVFIGRDGHPLRTRNFRRVWLTATRTAGVEGVTFHGLRHTHAAWLISAGVPLTAIQRRLGHASIQITSDRYGHLLPVVDERISQALDAALPRGAWGQTGGIDATQDHARPRETTGNSKVKADIER